MNKDIVFLVNSCDKYEDAWHPFFECLKIFGVSNEYQMILNTETKNFEHDYYDVITINTPQKCTWSERLINVLSKVDTEFVFFLLEDYFLEQRFDGERFDSVIKFMKDNPDVGYVDIKPRWAASEQEYKENFVKYAQVPDEFAVRESEDFNITCSPAIWRTEALRSLLRKHEDIWQFEYYSGIRAKKYDIKVVRYFTHTPTIYEYSYQIWSKMGITRGQWLPKNVEFFNNLGIAVNFDRLGILQVSSIEDIKRMRTKDIRTLIKKAARKVRYALDKNKSLR